MASCARCGQLSLSAESLCPACLSARYGAQERHAAPRLFDMGPAPMAGQMDIRLNANTDR